MYEADIKELFSKVPVFSLADLTQVISNRTYAKKFISAMIERKKVRRIKKDLYTYHDDPSLISTYILKPSYISGVSALSYHHLITQIPKEIFCCTSKPTKTYFFIEKINFHHTKFFFGFGTEKYLGFDIQVATPEKALIDSIGYAPLSVTEEALDDMDTERMVSYLRRIKKSNTIKRIGYMLESRGHDIYPELKRYINDKYIPLDPLAKHNGAKNSKWKVTL